MPYPSSLRAKLPWGKALRFSILTVPLLFTFIALLSNFLFHHNLSYRFENKTFDIPLNFDSNVSHVRYSVTFSDSVLLILKAGSSVSELSFKFSDCVCLYGGSIQTEVITVDGGSVRCHLPEPKQLAHLPVPSQVTLSIKGTILPSVASYSQTETWRSLVYETIHTEAHVLVFVKGMSKGGNRTGPSASDIQCLFGWDSRMNVSVFTNVQGWTLTKAIDVFQEIVLCEHPSMEVRKEMCGRSIHVRVNEHVFPSVVEYNPSFAFDSVLNQNTLKCEKEDEKVQEKEKGMEEEVKKFEAFRKQKSNNNFISSSSSSSFSSSSSSSKYSKISNFANQTSNGFQRKFKICACTMIMNAAKFLKEWMMYHSYLGIEKYFLYDNNSEDDLLDVLKTLSPSTSPSSSPPFEVSRYFWPWHKTQEAGFSHCTYRGEKECEWMVFIDVDEFIFPIKFLPNVNYSSYLSLTKKPSSPSSPSSPFLLMLDHARNLLHGKKQLGQVSIKCYNFGASGLHHLLPSGQILSYTCRQKKPTRHKSFVLLDALPPHRGNKIHHFHLRSDREFSTVEMKKRLVAINHYKFPVWEDFKAKFKRRVSGFVPDWTENVTFGRNLDRVEGLGVNEPSFEPTDWAERYCEVEDGGLKAFVLKRFCEEREGGCPWE